MTNVEHEFLTAMDDESCLHGDLSGLDDGERDKDPLSPAEVEETLNAVADQLRPSIAVLSNAEDGGGRAESPAAVFLPSGSDDAPLGEIEASRMVPVPRFKAIHQARAVTRRRRTAANIDTIVLHTPEGYEQGTLNVLKGTRAGFDIFLAPDGDLYKCNDWFNYVAWQAGDRDYNHRSVGFEINAFAATSGDWSIAYYRRVAHVCAWLIETLGIPLRHAKRYGEAGLIYHRTITPKKRSDPGANFRMPLLLDLIGEFLKGQEPEPRPRAELEQIWFCCHPYPLNEAGQYADAAVEACHSVGLTNADLATSPDAIRRASYRARHGKLGQYVAVIFDSAERVLHPDARAALRDADGQWFPPDRSDLWDAQQDPREKAAWRLAALADYEGVDKEVLLEAYRTP